MGRCEVENARDAAWRAAGPAGTFEGIGEIASRDEPAHAVRDQDDLAVIAKLRFDFQVEELRDLLERRNLLQFEDAGPIAERHDVIVGDEFGVSAQQRRELAPRRLAGAEEPVNEDDEALRRHVLAIGHRCAGGRGHGPFRLRIDGSVGRLGRRQLTWFR